MAPTTDSHMYRTMHRQPDDLRRLLAENSAGWQQAEDAASRLAGVNRVYVTGIGTSYHAALVGAWLLRAAGLDACAIMSPDFALYPEQFPISNTDAVIVMAHTGVKQFSASALQRAVTAGATTLAVGSLTAEHPGSDLVLRTIEREQSAAYTASHLTAMTVIAQVATILGEQHGIQQAGQYRAALASLPEYVATVLDREADILPFAQAATSARVYAAGFGPNEATALELVIKAREAAYAWVDALAAEQFLHGPMVTVNPGDLAVMVHVPGPAAARTAAITGVLAAIGARLLVVGQPVTDLPEDATVTTLALPGLDTLPETLTPILAVVPMQILAYQMAAAKGINPDTFRRDDDRYKAAFGRLTL